MSSTMGWIGQKKHSNRRSLSPDTLSQSSKETSPAISTDPLENQPNDDGMNFLLRRKWLATGTAREFVVCVNKKNWYIFTVRDAASAIVMDLKWEVHRHTGIPPKYQDFTVNNFPIDDGFRVSDLPCTEKSSPGDPIIYVNIHMKWADSKKEMIIQDPFCTLNLKKKHRDITIVRCDEKLKRESDLDDLAWQWRKEHKEQSTEQGKRSIEEAELNIKEANRNLQQVRKKAQALLKIGHAERRHVKKEKFDENLISSYGSNEGWNDFKKFIKVAWLYILFIIVFDTAVFLDRSQDISTQFFPVLMRKTFENISIPWLTTSKITRIEDFWRFLDGNIIDLLFPKALYNDDPFPDGWKSQLYDHNVVVGTVRLRMLRTGVDICELPLNLLIGYSHCYRDYIVNTEINDATGPSGEYKWKNSAGAGGVPSSGLLEIVYSGSGYPVDLPKNTDNAHKLIKKLWADRFISLQSRAMFFQFTVYNPNLDRYTSGYLLYEFPIVGGVKSSSNFQALKYFAPSKLDRLPGIIAQVTLFVFYMYYIVHESIKMSKGFKKYWRKDIVWRIIDWLNFTIYAVTISLRLFGWILMLNTTISPADETYYNFQTITFYGNLELQMNALNCNLIYFKILKYFNISRRMTFIGRVLRGAAYDLSIFVVVFMVIFIALSQTAFMLYGNFIEKFRSFKFSFYTLFSASRKGVRYSELEVIEPVFAAFFYLGFMFMYVFLFSNITFANLLESYTRVAAFDESDDMFYNVRVTQFVRNRKGNFKFYIKTMLKMIINFSTAIRMVSDQGPTNQASINYSQMESIFQTHNHIKYIFGCKSTLEFMSKYDKDGDGILTENEIRELKFDVAIVLKKFDAYDVMTGRSRFDPSIQRKQKNKAEYIPGSDA